MATPEGLTTGDDELIFVAHNQHDPRCGRPPRLRNADNPELYHGYFENIHGEQFVFTFDPATKSGVVWGGDLGWDNPKAFNLAVLDEALHSTQEIAAQVVEVEGDEASKLPVIDAALALGRLTGLTGKDEIIWLRACLEACMPLLLGITDENMPND
jgi:hypothetical protein